jgi:hypothetical protein
LNKFVLLRRKLNSGGCFSLHIMLHHSHQPDNTLVLWAGLKS